MAKSPLVRQPKNHPGSSGGSSAFSVFVILAGLLFLGLLGFRAAAAARGIPLLGIDAFVFLPQTVPYHRSGELLNLVWSPAASLDSLGKGRMVYHGFLFPMALSLLMGRSDYLGLSAAVATVQTLATFLPGVMFWQLARRGQRPLDSWQWFLILILTAAGANYSQGGLGRPEPLVAVFLVGAVIAISRTPLAWHGGIAGGIAIGLTAATDLVPSILAGSFFAAYSGWRLRGWRCVREIFIAAFVALAVFGLCFAIYPYPFADWWSGTLRMGRYALGQGEGIHRWPTFLKGYMVGGSTWILAVSLLLVVWSLFRILRRHYQAGNIPQMPLIFYGALLAAAAVLFRFVFYAWWASYTLLPLMPLGFIAVFYEIGLKRSERRPVFRTCAFAVLLLASLGLLGDVVERAQIWRSGVMLPEAREKLARFRAQHPNARIALERNLFTLTENFDHLVYFPAHKRPAHADFLVFPQAYLSSAQPPLIEGFQLRENYFTPTHASFFGVPFWTRDRGCGFAIYARR